MAIPRGPTFNEPASFQDIQDEFGGLAPIGLNEYYAGVGLVGNPAPTSAYQTGIVPAGPAGPGNPISVGNFLGLASAFVFNDVVSTDVFSYNLRSRAVLSGWDGSSPLIATVTIDPGVTVYGAGTGVPGFTLGTPVLPGGSTVTLTNNGTIAGHGGDAGAGGSYPGVAGTNGGIGGNALSVNYPITIANNDTIGGGGGGGGGGSAFRFVDSKTGEYTIGGSGGGGGRVLGAGGAGGTATGGTASIGGSGANGNIAAPGGGGFASGPGPITSGSGGAGGNLGQPGFNGGNGSTTAGGATGQINTGFGLGGAAGAAVVGGANITWTAYGTRLGSIDNPGINGVPGSVVPTGNWLASAFLIAAPTHEAFARIGFDNDGEVVRTEGTTQAFAPSVEVGEWWNPAPSQGIGSAHWCRATRTSGTASYYDGAPLNTWINLGTSPAFGHSNVPGNVQDSINATYQVQISTSATGTPVVATHTVTINIEVEL